jgi:hypothetical protein
VILDPFGDRFDIEVPREIEQRTDEEAIVRRPRQVLDEGPVDLDQIEAEPPQILERAMPAAEIVHADANASDFIVPITAQVASISASAASTRISVLATAERGLGQVRSPGEGSKNRPIRSTSRSGASSNPIVREARRTIGCSASVMRPWFNPAKMSSAVRSARNLASDTLSKGSNAAKRRAPACRARSTASSACWKGFVPNVRAMAQTCSAHRQPSRSVLIRRRKQPRRPSTLKKRKRSRR